MDPQSRTSAHKYQLCYQPSVHVHTRIHICIVLSVICACAHMHTHLHGGLSITETMWERVSSQVIRFFPPKEITHRYACMLFFYARKYSQICTKARIHAYTFANIPSARSRIKWYIYGLEALLLDSNNGICSRNSTTPKAGICAHVDTFMKFRHKYTNTIFWKLQRRMQSSTTNETRSLLAWVWQECLSPCQDYHGLLLKELLLYMRASQTHTECVCLVWWHPYT